MVPQTKPIFPAEEDTMDTSIIVRVISGALFLIVFSVLIVRRNKKSV
jgi:hypothetical protein